MTLAFGYCTTAEARALGVRGTGTGDLQRRFDKVVDLAGLGLGGVVWWPMQDGVYKNYGQIFHTVSYLVVFQCPWLPQPPRPISYASERRSSLGRL